MKQFITFICLGLCLSATAGNNALPQFGTIDKADLQLSTCDFDPDTDVMYLIDEGEAVMSTAIESITERRIRIKILKEAGIPEANIKIPYYSKDQYEQVDAVQGFTYNLDDAGNIEMMPLEQKLIFDKKLDSRYSEVSFAFPQSKSGHCNRIQIPTHKAPWVCHYRRLVFSAGCGSAVQFLSCHYSYVPHFYPAGHQPANGRSYQTGKRRDGYTFVMKNIPGLRNEPYAAGMEDYRQRVKTFSCRAILKQVAIKKTFLCNYLAGTYGKSIRRRIFGIIS